LKNQTVYFNSTSFDSDGWIVNWTWDFGDGNYSYFENVTHQYVDDGDYTVNLTVEDNDNATSFIEQVVSVGNLPPYEPSNPSPTNGTTGVSRTATLSWTGGDPNSGDIVTYDVYFGKTNPPTTKISSNQTTTSKNPGTMSYSTKYYWKIVAWDNNNTSTSGPIWSFTTRSSGGGGGGGSTPNNPPVADANGPYNGIIKKSITFDGSGSTDLDGSIFSYDWTFGDGTTAEGVTVTHSYTAVGNYTVKLIVTDNGGSKDSDTTYADISDKPNSKPNKPTIRGNQTGKKNTDYTYTAKSIDQDNDKIKYVFDWDDETDILVTDFMQSGTEYDMIHSWANPGLYTIKVKAIDEHNNTSDTTRLIVLIEAIFCDNIGYIIDINSDDIYDLFHSNSTGEEIEIETKDGVYLIDTDGDGKWNYSFDLVSGLSAYQEDSKEDESPGFEFILLLCVIALFLIWKRKRKSKNLR
jgi:PKD repeat protein